MHNLYIIYTQYAEVPYGSDFLGGKGICVNVCPCTFVIIMSVHTGLIFCFVSCIFNIVFDCKYHNYSLKYFLLTDWNTFSFDEFVCPHLSTRVCVSSIAFVCNMSSFGSLYVSVCVLTCQKSCVSSIVLCVFVLNVRPRLIWEKSHCFWHVIFQIAIVHVCYKYV